MQCAHVLQGTVLHGAVQSKEDHGYIIDFGISNVSGFLPLANAKPLLEHVSSVRVPSASLILWQLKRDALLLGEPVLCLVAGTSGGRVFSVVVDPAAVWCCVVASALSLANAGERKADAVVEEEYCVRRRRPRRIDECGC